MQIFSDLVAKNAGESGINWKQTSDYVLKVRQRCRFGDVDLRSHIVTSMTGSGSTVPFYLQPTVDGSDIDSQPSLRGFPDYRFRASAALFVQTDYSVLIRDPIGLLVYYDAGRVGPTFSSLSFSHLRLSKATWPPRATWPGAQDTVPSLAITSPNSFELHGLLCSCGMAITESGGPAPSQFAPCKVCLS